MLLPIAFISYLWMLSDGHQTPDGEPDGPLPVHVQVLDGIAAVPDAASVVEEGRDGAGALAAAALDARDL